MSFNLSSVTGATHPLVSDNLEVLPSPVPDLLPAANSLPWLLEPQVVEQLRPLLVTADAGPGFSSGCDDSGKRLFIQFIFEEMRHRQVTEAGCWMLAVAEPS